MYQLYQKQNNYFIYIITFTGAFLLLSVVDQVMKAFIYVFTTYLERNHSKSGSEASFFIKYFLYICGTRLIYLMLSF